MDIEKYLVAEKIEKIGEYGDLTFFHRKNAVNPWIIMKVNKVIFNSKSEKTAKEMWRSMKMDARRKGIKGNKKRSGDDTALHIALTSTIT